MPSAFIKESSFNGFRLKIDPDNLLEIKSNSQDERIRFTESCLVLDFILDRVQAKFVIDKNGRWSAMKKKVCIDRIWDNFHRGEKINKRVGNWILH